jgi:hypothetical protein
VNHTLEPVDIGEGLEFRTFFTELRKRRDLRAKIWPIGMQTDLRLRFREEQLRAQLLSSTARLGNAFIDLYVMTIRRLGSIELRAQEADAEGQDTSELQRISEYLDLLESQRVACRAERDWSAFDELADTAEHFNLILDVNEPEARQLPLSETAVRFGQLLGRQQPVGGMAGVINKTLVRQFRMPGYPLALITTDLLQEGEDLHTFCSSVHHYGISWTPSSMEQRVGRIDRVRSQTDRRLSSLNYEPAGEDWLQVYLPHLEDTVEVLQVWRVLKRMNMFLRLMHEGLVSPGNEERKIDVSKEIAAGRQSIPQVKDVLKTAFPCESHLHSGHASLAVDPSFPQVAEDRFVQFIRSALPGLDVIWEPATVPGRLLGTANLGKRIQPFTLLLTSLGRRIMIRCISPVGRVSSLETIEVVERLITNMSIRIGLIPTAVDRTYDMTVEADVCLATHPASDVARLEALLRKVTNDADWLERELLRERDAPLEAFRKDLEVEGAS